MRSRIRSPLSRSYGGILPSSFTTILSIASVFSTYPPVSVWGTGGSQLAHEAFLGSIGSPTPGTKAPSAINSQPHSTRIYLHAGLPSWPGTTTARDGLPSCVPPQLAYYQIRSQTQPTPPPEGNKEGLACLVSRASARTLFRRYQNINWLSIDYACRPRLRSRLTQGRLA